MDAVTEKRQLGLQVIKRIEQLPRPEKWRVTREFVLASNKNASYADHKFVENVAKERNSMLKATGASKSGDSRYLLSMPDFIYAALIATDPDLQDELNNPDKKTSDRAWNKLAAAFPEYAIARKI
jgi:hypothetical protein